MKKTLQGLFILSMVFLLTACSKSTSPVSIGNISFNYNPKVWEHIISAYENAPLEFKDKNNNILSINVSQEGTYQHPLTMISFVENLFSDNESFEVFLEPNEINVNGTTWYEYGYQYSDGTTTYKVYQRYYGKYYNAASISYASNIDNYKSGHKAALKLMSDIKVDDVNNDEKENKAKEFLVGEWDLDGKGYLVLLQDGSYEWFRDNSKDKNNMHYGTYGCDIENETMSLYEGDGYYLVLFPESLVVDGNTQASLQSKSDYVISLENEEGKGYPMVNISTYTLYTMIRQ